MSQMKNYSDSPSDTDFAANKSQYLPQQMTTQEYSCWKELLLAMLFYMVVSELIHFIKTQVKYC